MKKLLLIIILFGCNTQRKVDREYRTIMIQMKEAEANANKYAAMGSLVYQIKGDVMTMSNNDSDKHIDSILLAERYNDTLRFFINKWDSLYKLSHDKKYWNEKTNPGKRVDAFRRSL